MTEIVNGCMLTRTCAIIRNSHGDAAADKLLQLAVSILGESNIANYDQQNQVCLMNRFWNKVLSPLPSTTEARAWLEDNADVEEYLESFEAYWMADVMRSGLLS